MKMALLILLCLTACSSYTAKQRRSDRIYAEKLDHELIEWEKAQP